ncbi:MAG: hypothetical protein GQE15_22490 [Archangiaceae bacterium]|nr:hypothetical protein [Archangiaceae bacterium]
MPAVILALLLQATAEEPVIDLVSSSELRVLTRLENELRALGYRVVRRRPDEPRTPGARGEVVASPTQLVARASLEQPRIAAFDDPHDDAVWAIRVSEWLRSDASTLHAPVVVTPAPVPAERAPWRFDLAARGLVRWSPSVGAGGGGALGFTVWPWRAVGFEVGAPGLTWLQVSREGLIASVRELAFAVRVVTALVLSERWAVVLGAGGGGRHVFVEGVTPVTGGVGQLVAELSAMATLRWTLTESFFLEWRNEVGVSLPTVALEFGGARVGVLGAPGLQTGLGGGISW